MRTFNHARAIMSIQAIMPIEYPATRAVLLRVSFVFSDVSISTEFLPDSIMLLIIDIFHLLYSSSSITISSLYLISHIYRQSELQ